MSDWNDLFFICYNTEAETYVREYYSTEKMDIDRPEVAGYFVGKEKIGSMRGYIWGRTLPLMKHNLLLGTGPDTFAYEFPNRDIFGKQYAYHTVYAYVEKAHNQYMQTFVQNGGIAFLAYLGILLLYLIDSIKLYGFKRQYAVREWFGLALCLAVVGYMGDTFFIDSCISNAPIFWVLLGVGIAVNRANAKAHLMQKEDKA